MNCYKKGLISESIAALFLMCLGYKIVERRLKNKVGEIDILAYKKQCYYIIEVKYRRTISESLESITQKQIKRCHRAFFAYANARNLNTENVRMKIAALAPWSWPKFLEPSA